MRTRARGWRDPTRSAQSTLYGSDEGWIITTSTFTRAAKELAKTTRVRLIDGKELGEWLEGLREQE
jgi:HJR/Mrr/RecB family endonuclease